VFLYKRRELYFFLVLRYKRGDESLLAKRSVFSQNNYRFNCGKEIPIQIGYQTYGTLNKQKDNVILVCHYFSATSQVISWWGDLIGEDKAIDTSRFFVICTENLCNVQQKNPNVITTGPASINIATGKPYGMDFPVFTFADMVKIQKALLASLGIQKLHAVIGPSAGGMIALHWTVQEPNMVERCIGIITNARNPVATSCNVLQHAIRAIQLDPNWNGGQYYGKVEPFEGLHLAAQMMYTNAFSTKWYEDMFKSSRGTLQAVQGMERAAAYEREIYEKVKENIIYCDANHWLYTSRATMLQDISDGFSNMQEALERIQAKVLLISCYEDTLQPAYMSEETVKQLQMLGKQASFFGFHSIYGHMGGILDTHLFAKKVEEWLVDK
jgi:homoserine O-acetyltransferase